MSYEDDVVAYAEQFKERWLKATDEVLLSSGYRTIYSMDAQEADVSKDQSKDIAKFMEMVVDAVCTAIENLDYVPTKIQVGIDFEGYDVDVVVTIRKRKRMVYGPEANSPQED